MTCGYTPVAALQFVLRATVAVSATSVLKALTHQEALHLQPFAVAVQKGGQQQTPDQPHLQIVQVTRRSLHPAPATNY